MPPEPQEPQLTEAPPIRQASFVERDMTNAELKVSLMNLTKLLKTQAHVVNNHCFAHANQGSGLNLMLVITLQEFRISRGLTLPLFMELRLIKIHKVS